MDSTRGTPVTRMIYMEERVVRQVATVARLLHLVSHNKAEPLQETQPPTVGLDARLGLVHAELWVPAPFRPSLGVLG